LHDGDVFYDVGSNVGFYSLYAAKLCLTCLIYSFEPESQNHARFCKNIVSNGITNIIPCNFPLSDRETFDSFYVGEMQSGSSIHSFGEQTAFQNALVLKQGVISITLDALVLKYKVAQRALIKIDVDGIEDKILNGAELSLKLGKIRTILVELNFQDEDGVIETEQKLRLFGYKLVKKSNWVWESGGLKSRNYIFYRQ
jgi:FkbM family methyltransferase